MSENDEDEHVRCVSGWEGEVNTVTPQEQEDKFIL